MLLLSRLTGRDVRAHDGELVGHVADLTVPLGGKEGPHLVERVLVRRRDAPDLLVPWSSIDSFTHTHVVLAPGETSRLEITSIADALEADEILLVRDVLDTQIVDVVGHRVARVADVVLARNPDNRLDLVGAEVGFAGVLRRLGLHQLAARTRENAVAWTDLHLTSERGHAVQLATPRSAVHHLDARALAALVSRLDTESAAEVLVTRGPGVAAEAVRAAHPVVGERVLRALPGAHVEKIVAAMPAEHATHWRGRLAHRPVLRGRRLTRFRVWPRRRQVAGKADGP